MDIASPITAPSGRASVDVALSGVTRIRVHLWPDHPDVINPGDMLLIGRIGDTQAAAEVRLYLRGKEMSEVADAALVAAAQYEENREWLSAPVTRHVGGAA